MLVLVVVDDVSARHGLIGVVVVLHMVGLQAHALIVKVDIVVRDVELAFFPLGAACGYFRDFGFLGA